MMTKHSKEDEGSRQHVDSAGDEVLREIRNAEHRAEGSPEERRHRGEAADAITPNTDAQEQSEGD
ncbi:hypothetical protein ACWEGX_31635 [Streptomyces chartreusis]|uniref:hypothetical protein n=1 Tax=Streptomyces chartreusis TaxID=1969 RepID=UPI00342EEF28